MALAGSNTLVLVLSASDNADAPTGRVELAQGTVQAGSITWECFAAGKGTSFLPSPGSGPVPAEAPTPTGKFALPECRV